MRFDPDREPVRQLIEQYDDEAAAYRDHWGPIIHPIACAAIDALPSEGIQRVLDVGAGVGMLLPVLRDRFPGARVVGVDRSHGMISVGDAGETVAVMDAGQLGIVDGSQDLVVMAFMLFHLPDPGAGLGEARRALRPGGMLCLSTWARDMQSPAVDIWNDALETCGAISAEEVGRLARHELMDSPIKVTALLHAAGFESIASSVHEFTHRIDPEDFIALRVNVGSNRRRFESLDPATREECVAMARQRLRVLPEEDLTLRMSVVRTTARAGAA